MSRRRLTRRQQALVERSQARRRALVSDDNLIDALSEAGLGPPQGGLVLTHHGRTLIVEDDTGQIHRCAARQNLGRLTCGDRVIWQASSLGDGVVVAVGERRSLLARLDYNGQSRPVAANLDRVVVVLAPTPEPSEYLLDRYLVAIAATGVEGLLLLNKVDLLDRNGLAALVNRMEPYRQIGYPLLQASSHTEPGLDALREALRGHVSLLVGQSGVGKSSLVKALLPDRAIRIQAVSAATGHGAHTTSASTLYHLPDGGDLIDTPGVRSFELGEIHPEALDHGFPELTPYLGHCRFTNCRHESEPDCALQEALAHGIIASRRLDSYRQLRAELETATKRGRQSS